MERFRLRAFLREHLLRQSTQQIFVGMFRRNSWGNPESVSGDGSDLTQTVVLRKELPALFARLRVRSVLDIPCGDCNWVSQILDGVQEYIGADIVPELIAGNSRMHAGPRSRFELRDIRSDPLPPVDVVLCRDCLVHLPLRDAAAALDNVLRSGSRYLLTTTYPGLLRQNKPLLITGNWRPLDLTLPPFRWPSPVEVLNEGCTEPDDFEQKSLGLWDLRQVTASLGRTGVGVNRKGTSY